MRRLLTVLVVFSILVVSGALAGTEKGQMELSPTVGIGLPLGDLDSGGFKMGAAFGVQFSYFTSPTFAIGLSIVHNPFGLDDDVEAALAALGLDLDFSITEVNAIFKYVFPSSSTVTPYLRGNAGVYSLRAKASSGGLSASDSESDFGFGAGVGLLFKGEGNVGGFIEAVGHDVLSEGSATQYVNVRGGVSFFFGGNAR